MPAVPPPAILVSSQLSSTMQKSHSFTNLRNMVKQLADEYGPASSLDFDDDLTMNLEALHADEFAYLSRKLTEVERRCKRSSLYRFLNTLKGYVTFIFMTWTKVLWAFIFFPTTFADRLSLVVVSGGAILVMTLLLPWCLLINLPLVRDLFDAISSRYCNGMSLSNAMYPTIFEDLPQEHIAQAKHNLSQPIKQSGNRYNRRIFNLDTSKLLLQCAALMYELTSHTAHLGAEATQHACEAHDRRQSPSLDPLADNTPGMHITDVCGMQGASKVIHALNRNNAEECIIRTIAKSKLGLKYTTVSELNTLGSAFCGLFYDPEDTFIIVAFRGTSPTDFEEWRNDFKFQMREAGLWLRGFGRVHDGFMNKIFPNRIPSGSRMPYSTITEAIRSAASSLSKNKPGEQINIWFTGHSLGCALASLAYSRMILEMHECGANTVLRDAYLFAAPVMCDVVSSNAFNGRMNHFIDTPRTMWRITNGKDVVATSLPDEGDNAEWLISPWNVFSFSHLGCELTLCQNRRPCQVSGTHITPGSQVIVASAFHNADETETLLEETIRWLQNVPLLGRVLSHAPGFYWVALKSAGTGSCEWVFD